MNRIADEVGEGTEKAVRQAALAALTGATFATPVDKGVARANWNVEIGIPDLSYTDSTNATASIARGGVTIQKYNLNKGSIFISNNLPYIGRLENGYSRQAPEGMSKQAVASARQVFRSTKLLKGF